MSIATLKKKSNNLHGSFHSAPNGGGFSLNGAYRNQSYVGINLGKHYPRTIMKGDVECGHGGCCGKYNTTPIVVSDGWTTEDISIVKSSVVNTRGQTAMKYRWVRRPYPFTTLNPQKVVECCKDC
jgi:hypothetical protein